MLDNIKVYIQSYVAEVKNIKDNYKVLLVPLVLGVAIIGAAVIRIILTVL